MNETIKRHAREGDDELVMLDGRRFFTHDNWQTVWVTTHVEIEPPGVARVRMLTGKAADRVRYLAVAQSSAGP